MLVSSFSSDYVPSLLPQSSIHNFLLSLYDCSPITCPRFFFFPLFLCIVLLVEMVNLNDKFNDLDDNIMNPENLL